MTDKVQPALTPELWGKAKVWVPEGGADPGGRLRHALGALCLYGQPYGVTYEMADAINRAGRGEALSENDQGLIRTAIDVILALLPPREPNSETVQGVRRGEG